MPVWLMGVRFQTIGWAEYLAAELLQKHGIDRAIIGLARQYSEQVRDLKKALDAGQISAHYGADEMITEDIVALLITTSGRGRCDGD